MCMLFSGTVYLFIHQLYNGNAGGTTSFQLWNQLKSFTTLKTFFYTSTTYGLPLGSRLFFLHIIYVIWIMKNVWKNIPHIFKQHAKIAAIINVPLYLLFCAPGELRNLSFLYLSFILATTYYIKKLLENYYLE